MFCKTEFNSYSDKDKVLLLLLNTRKTPIQQDFNLAHDQSASMLSRMMYNSFILRKGVKNLFYGILPKTGNYPSPK